MDRTIATTQATKERSSTSTKGARTEELRIKQIENPQELLKLLYDIYPGISKEELLKAFELCVRKRDKLLSDVIKHYFYAFYWSVERSKIRAKESSKPDKGKVEKIREDAVKAARETVKKVVERRVQVALLDLMMPNGKTLKECTGEECWSLSKTYGTFLANIAKLVPAKKQVGQVLSEHKLRHVYEDVMRTASR